MAKSPAAGHGRKGGTRNSCFGDTVHDVRFGLSFPNFGTYAEPSTIVSLAVAAERAGWDGFFIWDHIVVADGMPVADPLVALGAIGQATSSIKLGPMILALPRHRPWVVARQAATLDRLTDGRLILGVGIGYPPDVEFGTFGDPTDARMRADMLDEGLSVITGMWGADAFEFAGDHYTVHRNRFEPSPVQVPRIPIWVAGMLPNLRPFRRAARFDGVCPIRSDMRDLTPEEVANVVEYVRRHRDTDAAFDVVIGGPIDVDLSALRHAGVTWYLAGPSPEGESIGHTLAWIGQGPPT